MKLTRKTYLIISLVIILVTLMLSACSPTPAVSTEPEAAEAVDETQSANAGKKIMYVDSYHADYEWSAAIEAGVRAALQESGVELEVVRLDTKRNTSEEFGIQAGKDAKAAIDAFDPDVVIACDLCAAGARVLVGGRVPSGSRP